ncbi:hypothetical protein F2Q69_00005418 [Brassica cretica]|uniref:Uncharacterized protein n=1 Tax=Brassica cretica TaxID=69181 RepID=A0A8S9PD41_BRACR|nr:hypothetical protein F2Q69_00005418 [Brassica cretica]
MEIKTRIHVPDEEEQPLSPAAHLFQAPKFNLNIISVIGSKSKIDPDVIIRGFEQTFNRHPRLFSGIRAASLWFLNRRTILDVMLISSCNLYPFMDESPFVERECHEIYREIYGDPIYDVYEDDEIYKEICGDPIYDVYEENDFDNLVRAKIGRNLVYAEDFKHNQARAIFVQKQFYEEFGSCEFCADSTCEDFVQHPILTASEGSSFAVAKGFISPIFLFFFFLLLRMSFFLRYACRSGSNSVSDQKNLRFHPPMPPAERYLPHPDHKERFTNKNVLSFRLSACVGGPGVDSWRKDGLLIGGIFHGLTPTAQAVSLSHISPTQHYFQIIGEAFPFVSLVVCSGSDFLCSLFVCQRTHHQGMVKLYGRFSGITSGEELFGLGCLCLISLSLTLIDIEAHPNAAVFSIPSFLAVVESCPAYLGLCSLAFGGEMYSWVIGINLSLCLFNLFIFMTSNASLTDSITSLDKLLEK